MKKSLYSIIESKILEEIENENTRINILIKNGKTSKNNLEKTLELGNIFPTKADDTVIDTLIEVLTKNILIKEDIAKYGEIIIYRSKRLDLSLNKIIDLINFIKNDELFSKSNMKFSLENFSVEDQIIVEIKTGITCEKSLKHFDKIEYDLLKNIWNKLESKGLEKVFLPEIIKDSMAEIKDSQGINLSYQYVLRILSKFNWTKLSEEYSKLSDNFKNFFQQEQVKSEHYHFKKAEDLHFYMVKVTQKNAHFWDEFTDKQGENDTLNQYSAGLVAVNPSLDFFDYDKTDVWVTFIANQEVDVNQINHLSLDQTNYNAIEMFVTILTSENACFTSHSGISRCPSYLGQKHDRISADLHSFTANATLKNYDLEKTYMITCPVAGMREIIIKTFEKEALGKYCYIGHEVTNPFINAKNCSTIPQYEKQKNLVERIKQQNEDIANGEKKIPIKVNTDANSVIRNQTDAIEKCTSFEIYDQKGKVLQVITPEMMIGELAWFFEHVFLFSGQNEYQVLLTTDMKVLAGFIDNPDNPIEIEYAAEIEMVGDSIPY